MTYSEHERAAYLIGNLNVAELYHRLDQLTQALGETVAELESLKEKHSDAQAQLKGLKDELILANNYANDLQRELDRATS